jgi:AraC-like DNA-binding protein
MDYTSNVNKTIDYIEQHLCDKLSLDELSRVSGFSKYHLLRVFKMETGKGVWEYVLNLRMMQAAKLLLSTDLGVIDIALYYQFESQEAFTRAFKKEYALPPGKYRKLLSNLYSTEEAVFMNQNEVIPGWIVTGSDTKSYEISTDHENSYHGANTILIKSRPIKLEFGTFYTIMQQFKATNYIGKRIRFSGYIRSEVALGWGGLWMRINNNTSGILKLDNMQNRPIKGNTDWNYYSIVLDVPENSSIINIGVLLNGTGKLWISNISYEIVDLDIPTTDVDLSSELPEAPVNLSLNDK